MSQLNNNFNTVDQQHVSKQWYIVIDCILLGYIFRCPLQVVGVCVCVRTCVLILYNVLIRQTHSCTKETCTGFKAPNHSAILHCISLDYRIYCSTCFLHHEGQSQLKLKVGMKGKKGSHLQGKWGDAAK